MEPINMLEDLQELVRQGFTDWKSLGDVDVQRMDDLQIFCYSNDAVYASRWNPFERMSRGLILRDDGEIVARAFDKFFNWGELAGGAPQMTGSELVEVTEKLDGSLGVLFRHQGGYRIATKGSFTSDQALWATRFLNDHYDLSGLPEELTLIFEIIYPENRIVVDYGDRTDMVLIGTRNRFTGEDLFYSDYRRIAEEYGFPTPQVYTFGSVSDVVSAARTLGGDQEGWVLRFQDGQRFKVKGEEYKKLHWLMTSISDQQIIQLVGMGLTGEVMAEAPTEFLERIRQIEGRVLRTVANVRERVEQAFAEAPKGDRKAFSLWVWKEHRELASYLFVRLDGRDYTKLIYRNEFGVSFDRPLPKIAAG